MMPSAKIDGRGWKSCQAMLPRAGPCACLCRGSDPRQRLFAEDCSSPRAWPSAKTLCRVPENLPSANPHALGKDALSGSETHKYPLNVSLD